MAKDKEADAAAEGPLVLVADDDGDIVYLIGLMLTDAGYRVQGETSLQGVEQRLAQEPLPACVVLDVKMGPDDMTTLVSRLRANPRTHHLPVLLISARVDVVASLHGGDLDTSGLSKPFAARQLVAAVAASLDYARRR